MNCRNIKEDLTAYRDGMLAPKKREEIDRHLGECPSCRQELEGIERVVSAVAKLRQATEIAPSAGAKERLLAALETLPAREEAASAPTWAERLSDRIRAARLGWEALARPLAYATAGVGLVILLAVTFGDYTNDLPASADDMAIAIDQELFSDIDIFADMDVLEDIDLLKDWEG